LRTTEVRIVGDRRVAVATTAGEHGHTVDHIERAGAAVNGVEAADAHVHGRTGHAAGFVHLHTGHLALHGGLKAVHIVLLYLGAFHGRHRAGEVALKLRAVADHYSFVERCVGGAFQ